MTEQRSKTRYPINLPVRWRKTDGLLVPGTTINMSSYGTLIHSPDDRPKLMIQVQAIIDWPFVINGRVPLKLWIGGTVVRHCDLGFAIFITRHEFRTSALAILPDANKGAKLARDNIERVKFA